MSGYLLGLLLGFMLGFILARWKFAADGQKAAERFIRQETQWPNFTWVKAPPLLKPSEKKK